MEELDRLIEMVKSLVDQVKILSETVALQSARQEELFKTQQSLAELAAQREVELKQTIDNLGITDQALKNALDDIDGTTDDLATISAALLTYQKGLQSEQ